MEFSARPPDTRTERTQPMFNRNTILKVDFHSGSTAYRSVSARKLERSKGVITLVAITGPYTKWKTEHMVEKRDDGSWPERIKAKVYRTDPSMGDGMEIFINIEN